MKILLVSPIAPPSGGIATWTKLYLESEQLKNTKIDLVNTAILGNRKKNMNSINLFTEAKRFIKIIKKMNKSLKSNKYDIVHVNSSCSKLGIYRDYLCIKKSAKKNIKTIVHFHCDMTYMLKTKFQKKIVKKIIKYSDKIFVLNNSSMKYIDNLNLNKPTYIIPNFIKNDLILNKKEINKEIKNIIFVGNISKQKGCDEIINIAKNIPKINFKLIGRISEEFKNIDTPKNLKLLGEKEHEVVFNELCSSDLFLFPTHTEGFPCALLEAMAVGLPIITTSVGAIPDMIENKGGICCNINNTEEFINSINSLIYDKEKRTEMSNWNINKVKKNYTIDKVIEKIYKLYSED